MGKSWEFRTSDEMLNYLVGHSYGPHPEEKLSDIRAEKKTNAQRILHMLDLQPADEVLEIGSGSGLISKHIAPQVGVLHCCDISQSFIKVAKKECSGILNITFNKIKSGQLDFLADNSIHAAYSHNVFIHLNLFEIYHYLRELQRVLRPGGKVWFDLSMAESFTQGVPQIFKDMAEAYRHKPAAYPGLLKWNSRASVEALAADCGLVLFPNRWDDNSFVFRKANPGEALKPSAVSLRVGRMKWSFSRFVRLNGLGIKK
jgi:SAM-dependent methyltransferase